MRKIKKKLCKQCGEEFTPYNTIQPVCSVKCALEYNQPEQIEQRYNEIKNDARSLNWYETKARKVFQTFIRIRDYKEPCISCTRTDSPQFDGGHYFKAELYSGLIFNEINVNKQCCYCNRNLHGNLIEYRKGLVKKYGEAEIRLLEISADGHRQKKYTKFELLQIEKHYKEKIKNLKKQNL